MADITDGDVIELTFHHSSSNLRPQEVVRHFRAVRTAGNGDLPQAGVLDLASFLWYEAVRETLPSVHTYDGASLRTVLPTYSDQITTVFSAGNGDATGSPLPPVTSLCLVMKCSGAPPHIVGRCYLPSTTVTYNNSQGRPTSGYIIDIAPIRSLLRFGFQADDGVSFYDFVSVVWSRLDGETFDVTSVSSRRAWSQQRRRGGFWAPLPPL